MFDKTCWTFPLMSESIKCSIVSWCSDSRKILKIFFSFLGRVLCCSFSVLCWRGGGLLLCGQARGCGPHQGALGRQQLRFVLFLAGVSHCGYTMSNTFPPGGGGCTWLMTFGRKKYSEGGRGKEENKKKKNETRWSENMQVKVWNLRKGMENKGKD